MADKLQGVHPDLVKVVHRAFEITTRNFRVTEGLRSPERQKQLIKEGKSRVMKSRHLSGHAVDVVALFDKGAVSWDFKHYLEIANAFAQAAQELSIPIRWGGCWQVINGKSPADIDGMCKHYTAECHRVGKVPLIDGVHFELPFEDYPA